MAPAAALADPSPDLPAPQFEKSFSNPRSAGHVKLLWRFRGTGPESGDVRFELQRAGDPAFEEARTVYEGPDLASFISGMPNGEYYFRVRADVGGGERRSAWSRPLRVEVKHQSLTLAFTLFGVGAVVFLATTALVILGSRRADGGQDRTHG